MNIRIVFAILVYGAFCGVGNSAFSQDQIAENLLNEVQIALIRGDVELSEKIVDTLLSHYPDNSQLWYYRGLANRLRMNFSAATMSFRKSLNLDPHNPELYKQLAQSCYDQDDYVRCLLYADSILQTDSLNRNSLKIKGQALLKLSRYGESKGSFLKLHQNDSLNTWYIKQLGGIATKIDSISEALHWYTLATEIDSMDMRSYTHLGSLFVKAELYEEGLPVLTTAIRRDSSHALLFRFRGSLGIMGANFEQAESDFKTAIQLGDSVAFTFRHYGLCLFKQSEYQKALKVYKATLKLDPDDAKAWYYLGFCYKWDEDIEMAIACLDKALILSASSSISDVYDGLGQFHGFQRDYDNAIHNYSRAYEWNPLNPIPLAQIGMLVEQSGGKKEHAKNYYKSYLKKSSHIENAYLIQYVNNRINIINEKLFMEGKLKRD
ncbi:MAG: tetratricopeptide repeat protein [Bacteroidota bacterium]|nr:tetratricopeptide repeat protein [Bacteroidota bacterium]